MIQRNVRVGIEVTPDELAVEFANMDDSQQATFFNVLAILVSTWDRPFCFQLQSVTDNPALTEEGRSIMKQIGEYAEVEVK